jgi:hypothetical protein
LIHDQKFPTEFLKTPLKLGPQHHRRRAFDCGDQTGAIERSNRKNEKGLKTMQYKKPEIIIEPITRQDIVRWMRHELAQVGTGIEVINMCFQKNRKEAFPQMTSLHQKIRDRFMDLIKVLDEELKVHEGRPSIRPTIEELRRTQKSQPKSYGLAE